MKRKNEWWCVVGCILLACVVQGEEGGPGGKGAQGSPSTLEEGQLLIVEVMADPHGVDTEKEYIEIHNPTDMALSLAGLELFVIPDSSGKEKSFALPSREIPPGAYVTFGDVSPANLPPHIDIGYDRALGALPNTKATVGLRKIGGNVIDSMHYTSTKVGRALSRKCLHMDSQQCAHEEAVWCFAETDTTYDGENYGSPQKPNAACKKGSIQPEDPEEPGDILPPATCLENGVSRNVRVPKAGQLILNELMAAPGAGLDEAESEWVELLALSDVDLNGLVLATRSRSQTIVSADCLPVKAHAYFLLVRSANPDVNGCLAEVDWPLNIVLPNNTVNGVRQSLTLSAGGKVVDTLEYPTAMKERSYQRSPGTGTWCQVPTSTPFYDTCRGDSRGNRGTPRGANVSCS